MRVNLRVCPKVANSLDIDNKETVLRTFKREVTECLERNRNRLSCCEGKRHCKWCGRIFETLPNQEMIQLKLTCNMKTTSYYDSVCTVYMCV